MRSPKPLRIALWLPACALFLTACGQIPLEQRLATKIERVVVSPPADLLTCPDRPQRPGRLETQDDLAPLLEAVTTAHQACRDQLDAVRRFVEETKP